MHFDSAHFNYAIANDEGEYYLDSIDLKSGIIRQLTSGKVSDKIMTFMMENSFLKEDIARVQASISRLRVLSFACPEGVQR